MPVLSKLAGGNSPQKVLVYGPPKSGKTQLIGQLAAEYQLIWFDLEAGKDTLLKLPLEYQERITLISIRDTVDAPRAHATIDKIISGGSYRICDDHGTIECTACTKDTSNDRWTTVDIPTNSAGDNLQKIIVIDSGSQLTTSINSTVNLLLKTSISVNSIVDRAAKDGFAEWDNQGKYLNRIMGAIQNAPFHVVMTAHEIEAEREDGSIKIVPSIGTRNYAINCAKFFGHVVYMDKMNLKHRAWSDTGFSNKVLTGSRLDVATEGMDEPSLLPIFRGEAGAGRGNRQSAAQHTMTNVTQQVQGAKVGFKLPGAK